jgi:hypothetical protein
MWQDPEYRARKSKQRSRKRGRRSTSEASSVYLGNGTEEGLEAAVAGAGSSSSSAGPAAAQTQPSASVVTAAGYYNGGLPAEEHMEINGAVLASDTDDEGESHGPHVESDGSESE